MRNSAPSGEPNLQNHCLVSIRNRDQLLWSSLLTLASAHPYLCPQVLDQHQVTGAERRKAAAQIGGDVQALTVAFMKRAPPHDPAWDAKVPERSQLEQELAKVGALGGNRE